MGDNLDAVTVDVICQNMLERGIHSELIDHVRTNQEKIFTGYDPASEGDIEILNNKIEWMGTLEDANDFKDPMIKASLLEKVIQTLSRK